MNHTRLQNNFSDTLTNEYELFSLVCPHHDAMQKSMVQEIVVYTQINSLKKPIFLDLGCGYGFSSILLAKELPDATYILNDIDEPLLTTALQNLSHVSTQSCLGDFETITKNIADSSIDVVYTAWVIHNFPKEKRKRVIAEIYRILKPGGMFINLDKIGNAGEQRTRALAQTLIDFTPCFTKFNKPQIYLDWIAHYFQDEQPELLLSDIEYNELLLPFFEGKILISILLEKIVIGIKKYERTTKI
jgi:tRNA (cmo5U34)-methyltransferase